MTPTALATFTSQTLSDVQIQRIQISGVFPENEKDTLVTSDRLRLLTLTYWGFDQQDHEGQLVTLDAAAKHVLEIFKALYQQKFSLQQVELMEKYEGEDASAMEANNTSCFSGRLIEGASTFSLHAYGLALDVNPVQNPCVRICEKEGIASYMPLEGVKYANRLLHRPDKVFRPGMAEEVVQVFYAHGFNIWGGNWNNPIDYQHFQVSRSLAELLAVMSPEDAEFFFERHQNRCYKQSQCWSGCAPKISTHTSLEEALLVEIQLKVQSVKVILKEYYQKNRDSFMELLKGLP